MTPDFQWAEIEAMATKKSESEGAMPSPVDLASLEAANKWFDFSSRWLLAVGALAAFATVAAFVLAFIQWKSDKVRERHAEWRIKTLEKETAQAKGETAKATEHIALLQTEAERLKAQAESDRLARAKIEERLADRSLTDEQWRRLLAAMSEFRGQEYEVTTYWDSREPMDVSNRISRALTAAGWVYLKPDSWRGFIGVTEGIEVYAHPNATDKTKSAATALVNALNENGLAAKLAQKNGPNDSDNIISLNVGIKQR